MRSSVLALLLAACGSDGPHTQGGSLHATDFIPAAGAWMQYGPTEAPADGPFLMIEVGISSWELREGTSWTEASSEEQIPVTDDNGLAITGTTVLPAELSEGAEQDGTTVVSIGDELVYYGTFSLAARTSVPSGRFAGEWVFAPGTGPIQLSVDGQGWELVYYE